MLTAREISALVQLGRRLDAQPEPVSAEMARLLFARWLVATGRLNEGSN